jgi:hypothetical protein
MAAVFLGHSANNGEYLHHVIISAVHHMTTWLTACATWNGEKIHRWCVWAPQTANRCKHYLTKITTIMCRCFE